MKTIVITGASAGVGRALARAYAGPGRHIGLIARGRRRLEDTAEEVEKRGGTASVHSLDVADGGAVEAAADAVAAETGSIEIWINNAMVTVYAPVHKLRADEIERVTAVTYLGAVHGTLAALRHMRPPGRGTIVQVASAVGYRPIPLQSAYCAAKAAMIAFSDSLRTELIHEGSGIGVTMMQLPAVNTPQFDWARNKLPSRPQPVPPIYSAASIARAIKRTAEKGEREIWIGAPAVKAILAQRISPSLAESVVAGDARTGQMTGEPAEDRQDNLYEPVDGIDLRAEGRFKDRARQGPVGTLSSSTRSGLLVGAAGVGAGFAALAAKRLFRRRSNE